MTAYQQWHFMQYLQSATNTLFTKLYHKINKPNTKHSSSSHFSKTFVPSSIIILSTVGWFCLVSTQIYQMEQSLCRTYYQKNNASMIQPDSFVPEEACKFSELQAQVSELSGWYDFFMSLPGLFVTVTFTRLAVRIGEKTIAVVTAITFSMQAWYFTGVCYFYEFFDIRMIWLVGFFDVFGGGWIVQQGIMYTYIAKQIPQDDLSDFFFAISAIKTFLSFFALWLSSVLLERHIWILSIIGNLLCTSIIPLSWFLSNRTDFEPVSTDDIQEHSIELQPSHEDRSESNSNSDSEDEDKDSTYNLYLPTPVPIPSIFSLPRLLIITVINDVIESTKTLTELFITDKFSRLLNLTYLLALNGYFVNRIFRRWAAKFFTWTLADANAIGAYNMFANGVALVILPILTRRVLKPRLGSAKRADLLVTKVSIVLMAVSCIIMSVGPPHKPIHIIGITVFSLGSGYHDALRSYAMTYLTEKGDESAKSMFNMSVGLVEVLAALISAPLWGKLFAMVLRVEWLNIGLPYWLASLSILASLGTVISLEKVVDGMSGLIG